MDQTDFLLKLKLQKGLGYVKILQIASQLESEEIKEEQLQRLSLPAELKEMSIQAYRNQETAAVSSRIKAQCQVVSFFDDLYPEKLRQIYRPPLLLFARGNLKLLQTKTLAIVGARQASNYSWQVIRRLVPHLIKKGWTIASGLAVGVDGMAHKAALLNHGPTIAVVGNGLNHYYPTQNQALQDQIIDKGLVISEYLPDTPPRPFRFPQRNRILAGLSEGVLVTEARAKSGSLITANLAVEENRDVYTVPGPITSSLSRGTNHLIAVGAIPVTDFELPEERFDN